MVGVQSHILSNETEGVRPVIDSFHSSFLGTPIVLHFLHTPGEIAARSRHLFFYASTDAHADPSLPFAPSVNARVRLIPAR